MNQADEGELLDVLNPDGSQGGRRKDRAEVHRDGDWHRSFHLWIIKDGDYVLVQRRSKSKDFEPLKLDVSVGGHFRAGEGLEEVLREAQEELGLTVHPKDLHYLRTGRVERFYEGRTDREFQEIYALRCDQPLEAYALNSEVAVLYEAPLAGLIGLYLTGGHLAVAGFDAQQRASNALLVEGDLISQARAETVQALEELQAWLEQEQGNRGK